MHGPRSRPGPPWAWIIGLGFLALIMAAYKLRPPAPGPAEAPKPSLSRKSVASGGEVSTSRSRAGGAAATTPEEIVATRLQQFAEKRLGVARALAERNHLALGLEVSRFFELAGAGDLAAARTVYEQLAEERAAGGTLEPVWPAIQETLGVLEATQEWPAQKLLDYGQAILGSLKPGMVYVGGTDAGRYIPTLLNETDGAEPHVILTQNALADRSYLEYAQFLNEGRLDMLSGADSDKAFSDYLADAQRRAQHDQGNPDAPRQLRPGEDVRITNGRVQVSGQVAVMSINEKLLAALMDKNPGVSFALEESFPFKSTYAQAVPLGPIMELRSAEAENAWSETAAAQVVEYWRTAAQTMAADSSRPDDAPERMAYAKLAGAHAALLQAHKYPAEAEAAYHSAYTLSPSSPEAVFRYVEILVSGNKRNEALAVAEQAARGSPQNTMFTDLAGQLRSLKEQP